MADDYNLMLNIIEPGSAKPASLKRKHILTNEPKSIRFEQVKKHKAADSHPENRLKFDEIDSKQKKKKHDYKKRRKYIPDNEFTPVASLFNKNPEIPALSSTEEASPKQGASSVFSGDNFEDLSIHAHLISNLKVNMGFTKMTQVQKLSIPLLLEGRDVLVKSATGSGKTICYALTIVARLMSLEPPIQRANGIHAVVIVPTRELAQQCFNVFQELCRCCVRLVPGLIIGGDRCKSEKARIRKGVNILVATPGRLLYHMNETACLNLARVNHVVLDEADKLLDMGFEKQVINILNAINDQNSHDRQNVLLSATLNRDVENLVALSLNMPVYVDTYKNEVSEAVDFTQKLTEKLSYEINQDDMSIPDTLQQSFVFVPAKLRLVTLIALIIGRVLRKRENKMIVFMSSKQSVDFHFSLIANIILDYCTKKSMANVSKSHIFKLHGDMPQQERMETFEKFNHLSSGVLLCTDVASRGLDIPRVNWIVQHTCPPTTDDYVHRVGRTARIGTRGKSLIFLLPSEAKFKEVLDGQGFVLRGMEMNRLLCSLLDKKLRKKKSPQQNEIELAATSLQAAIEEDLISDGTLMLAAKNAYLSFIRGYATYPAALKHIFHIRFLHLGHVAKSFGLREAPQKIAEPSAVAVKKSLKAKSQTSMKSNVVKRMQGHSEEVYYRDELIDGPRPRKITAAKKFVRNDRKKKLRI